MPSLASRLVPFVLALRGSKKVFSSADLTRKRVAALRVRPQSWAPPLRLDRIAEFSVRTVDGWPVYEVGPRGAAAARRALYLHGGAYIYEIQPQHWQLIAGLAATTGTRFTVPIYPLAPVGTAATIVPTATELAIALCQEVGAERTTLIGDSAGGGMALAVALQLRDRDLPAPNRTVLISPWVDVSMRDPALRALEPTDPWLGIDGARAAADLYRGELPVDDPRVSPISGDLRGLAPITLLSGTRDILNADAHRLVAAARAAGVPLDYHEAPGMLHVWPLLPIPEARPARGIIATALTSGRDASTGRAQPPRSLHQRVNHG